MALHRDVLWIGKQWAVTGHGMQLIDQRLMGAFDIEVAHLWEDRLITRMQARAWLNAGGLDKGLVVAWARHKPPEAGAEPVAATIPAADAIATPPPPPPPAESEKASPDLHVKMDGGAKFVRPWRVWMKKT